MKDREEIVFGWAGTILHVDLSRRRVWKEPLSVEMGGRFLGGRGINAKLLWDLIGEPRIGSLDRRNVLIFGAGTLTGTSAPSSGRTTVTCKSPTTELYLKTSMGGHWGAELKFAGYDHLVIHGASSKPVYVWIKDADVQVRDASFLWGMDVRQTDDALKNELDDKDVRIASIGPAGENLVRMAAVMSCVYHAAARGAPGAVMGSKRLKAVAVRGTGEIEAKNPDLFDRLALDARNALVRETPHKRRFLYGTSGSVIPINDLHAFPAYNFRTGHCEDVYPVSGPCLVEQGFLKRRVGCHGCGECCHRYTEVKDGVFAGSYSGGPEYETFSALGAGTGVFDTKAVLRANELCNILGLDTISVGSVIQWAMECYEREVLSKEDTEGMNLHFGNPDALVSLVEAIGYRRGKLGNLLAEGVKRAADKVGKDSWKWAICNKKGLEQSRVETRSAKGYALAFAVNPRGPDHLHSQVLAEFGIRPEGVALIERITGDKKWASPYLTEYRAEIVRWHEDCFTVDDSLGFCSFVSTSSYSVDPASMAAMFSAATEVEMSEKQIMMAGRRILTLEKCFNVREGADRTYDDLPWRLMNEPTPSGPAKGTMNSQQELDSMLDRYYELHEWDQKTSYPRRSTLRKLALSDVGAKLEKTVRLPD